MRSIGRNREGVVEFDELSREFLAHQDQAFALLWRFGKIYFFLWITAQVIELFGIVIGFCALVGALLCSATAGDQGDVAEGKGGIGIEGGLFVLFALGVEAKQAFLRPSIVQFMAKAG